MKYENSKVEGISRETLKALEQIADYSRLAAHFGHSSAQSDRTSVHLAQFASQIMLVADQRTC